MCLDKENLPCLLDFYANALARDTKRRILFLYGDTDFLDLRTFLQDHGGYSGGHMFQEIRGDCHFPFCDTDKSGIVRRAFQLVVPPSRGFHFHLSGDRHIEVAAHNAFLRMASVTGIHLDAVDSYLDHSFHSVSSSSNICEESGRYFFNTLATPAVQEFIVSFSNWSEVIRRITWSMGIR